MIELKSITVEEKRKELKSWQKFLKKKIRSFTDVAEFLEENHSDFSPVRVLTDHVVTMKEMLEDVNKQLASLEK